MIAERERERERVRENEKARENESHVRNINVMSYKIIQKRQLCKLYAEILEHFTIKQWRPGRSYKRFQKKKKKKKKQKKKKRIIYLICFLRINIRVFTKSWLFRVCLY